MVHVWPKFGASCTAKQFLAEFSNPFTHKQLEISVPCWSSAGGGRFYPYSKQEVLVSTNWHSQDFKYQGKKGKSTTIHSLHHLKGFITSKKLKEIAYCFDICTIPPRININFARFLIKIMYTTGKLDYFNTYIVKSIAPLGMFGQNHKCHAYIWVLGAQRNGLLI